MVNDAELLRRYAAQRAEAAFAEIVRRHLDAVYSAALRRVGGDTHLAQDVTQQVFVALARKAVAVSHHPVLTGWLYVTTRNEAANVVRTERRRKAREEEAQKMSEIFPAPESPVDWGRLAPVLDAAIDELGDEDRTAVLLRFVDHQTFAEIGGTMHTSEDAARMRVDRALEKLRARLSRRGITSTAAALAAALANQVVTAAPAGMATTITAAAVSITPAALVSGVSLLEFMSTTKALAGVAGLVVVASIGTVVPPMMALQQTQSAVVARQQEEAALTAALSRLEQRRDDAKGEAVRLERSLEDARAAALARRRASAQAAVARNTNAAAGAAAALTGPVTPEAIAAGQALMEGDPELKRAVIDFYRAGFAARMGGFFKKYQFTPAQIDDFERWMMTDGGVIRRLIGPNGELIAIAGLDYGNREKKQAWEQKHRWLGEAGFRDLREQFQRNHGQVLTGQLAAALAFTSTPLTTQQAQAFTRIVNEAGGRSGIGTFPWAGILAKADGILTGSQLEMIRGFEVQERYQLAMNAALKALGRSAAADPKKGTP